MPAVPVAEPGPPPRSADLDVVLAAAAADLGTRVPFDALRLGTVDPESGLIDTGRVVGAPRPTLRQIIEAEHGPPDVTKLGWLATQQAPVGLLSTATDGELARSHRFRTLLRPEGLAHELRIALVHRGVCWGYQLVYRRANRPDFSAAEVAHARAAAARLTTKLVQRVRTIAVGVLHTDRPGMIGLAADGSVDAADETARQILRSTGLQRGPSARVPLPLLSFITGLRTGDRPGALLPDPALGWLRLTGNRLRAYPGGQDRFTIAVQAATPLSVAPYLLYAHGATPRSTAVALRVLRGMTSAEIAADLGISTHTVQDHLKPVFAAFGVRGRRQLIGALFPHLAPQQLH